MCCFCIYCSTSVLLYWDYIGRSDNQCSGQHFLLVCFFRYKDGLLVLFDHSELEGTAGWTDVIFVQCCTTLTCNWFNLCKMKSFNWVFKTHFKMKISFIPWLLLWMSNNPMNSIFKKRKLHNQHCGVLRNNRVSGGIKDCFISKTIRRCYQIKFFWLHREQSILSTDWRIWNTILQNNNRLKPVSQQECAVSEIKEKTQRSKNSI